MVSAGQCQLRVLGHGRRGNGLSALNATQSRSSSIAPSLPCSGTSVFDRALHAPVAFSLLAGSPAHQGISADVGHAGMGCCGNAHRCEAMGADHQLGIQAPQSGFGRVAGAAIFGPVARESR